MIAGPSRPCPSARSAGIRRPGADLPPAARWLINLIFRVSRPVLLMLPVSLAIPYTECVPICLSVRCWIICYEFWICPLASRYRRRNCFGHAISPCICLKEFRALMTVFCHRTAPYSITSRISLEGRIASLRRPVGSRPNPPMSGKACRARALLRPLCRRCRIAVWISAGAIALPNAVMCHPRCLPGAANLSRLEHLQLGTGPGITA
jgi:hypothetical protein